MPRLYHRPAPVSAGAGRRIFIATPTYGGLDAGYAFALFNAAGELARAGVSAEIAILADDCHVDDARNRLVGLFLRGECETLVFIDADVRYEARDLLALIEADGDIVGATYPLKHDDESYPLLQLPGEQTPNDAGLLEVAGLPTGFMKIERHVLLALRSDAPKFRGKKDRDVDTPLLFERTLVGDVRWGGDTTFCRKARGAGFRVWLMPEVYMEHTGTNVWSGSWAHYQRRTSMGEVRACLTEIRHCLDTPQTYISLVKAWGSPWALSADMLAVVTGLARKAQGPILEFGSGISTLAMAAATPTSVMAVEHDDDWADRVREMALQAGLTNLRVYAADIKDGWYNAPITGRHDIILVDGPPRDLGDRRHVLNAGLTARLWLIDDMNTPRYREIVEQLTARGGQPTFMGADRPFAIVKTEETEDVDEKLVRQK